MTSTARTHTPTQIDRGSLSIGLLQQGAPELVSVWGAEINQIVVLSRQ